MTENTTKGPAWLLQEAWQLVRWQGGPEAWPDEFESKALAALMAGCRYKEDKRRYSTADGLISAGIKSGALAIRIVEEKQITPGRVIDTGESMTFAGLTARQVAVTAAIEKINRRQFIDRPACAAWLRAAGESPSEFVRAWLGAEWKEVSAGAAAPPPIGEMRKKAALIREVEADWPSIERDLQDASRNGLSATAKAAEHGFWYIESARKWAKQNGKLRTTDDSTVNQSASIAGQLRAATKTHKIR